MGKPITSGEKSGEGAREPMTPGVRGARNAVSDTMVAVGDVLGATIHTAADVGEDLVHGVGRVALTAVDETAHVLSGLAGGVRSIFAAGLSGVAGANGRRREDEQASGAESGQL